MSNTLVSKQLTVLTLPDIQSSQINSIMSGTDSSMSNSVGESMELLSGIPAVPLSSMQGHSVDCYGMICTPEVQDTLMSCTPHGQSESMSDDVDKQLFAMRNGEAGQAQVIQPTSGDMELSLAGKRKATTEFTTYAQGPQKMFVPNRRVTQVRSSAKPPSPTSASMSNSSRSPVSGRKVVQVESVVNKSQSTVSKKNAQPQVSPKNYSESCESVRAKLRESLASALALTSKQQECSSDGKMIETKVAAISQKGVGEHKPSVSGSSIEASNLKPGKEENASTSIIACPADGSNDVRNGSQTNIMCEEASKTWNCAGPDFPSNPVSSGEDDSFKNSFTYKDDLLQGNGLSWAPDLSRHILEVEQVENTEKPEVMHEGMPIHEKEQRIESPESVAYKIESELFKLFGGVNKKYKEKGRSLLFNLKDRNNPELRERVMSGEIPPDRLCSMTAEELASKELSQWRIAKAEELDHMKVLPDPEPNMRRLVKKTHKGEYQVDFDIDTGASEDIPLDTSVRLNKRPKINDTAAAPPLKAELTKAAQDNCEITIPSEGADMQGLMVDDVRDLPPIVSLDEFMESLDKEPPFENLPVDCGRTPESDSDNAMLGSESKSPVQPSKHPVEITSQKTKEVDVESTKADDGVKSMESQKRLDTRSVVRVPKGECIWEGLLQINISSTDNFIALYKSGEKASTREWPGFVEIKGRVKLDAFDKFVQALPMSRSRAIMVSHFALKEESSDSDRANLTEVVDSYIVDQRLGFAEPAPGVELYLCPPRTKSVDVIINHLPKSYTEKLSDIDDGLIGIVVWRKVQITPSAISPNSSSHHKDATKKHHLVTVRQNTENEMNRNNGFASRPAPLPLALSKTQPDDDDDTPPGFGPPANRDDDDLPEFNYSGSSNPPVSRDMNRISGQGMGSRHSRVMSRQVEQMRELVQKYGQNELKARRVPSQQWNDDDDDIPEWQPHQEAPAPAPRPPPSNNFVLPPHMANQLPLQRPPWPPLAQPIQPLQPPMSVHQQGAWQSHGPNSVGSQPSGQFYDMSGLAPGHDWRSPASKNHRGY